MSTAYPAVLPPPPPDPYPLNLYSIMARFSIGRPVIEGRENTLYFFEELMIRYYFFIFLP